MEETSGGEGFIPEDKLTQASYQETPYTDASWEVIGEPPGEEVFVPMEVEKAISTGRMVDPMFADYGGLDHSDSIQRWHLPEGQAVGIATAKDEEEEDNSIKLSEEELESLKAEAFEAGKKFALEGEVAKNAERMTAIEHRLSSLISDLNTQIAESQRMIESNAVEFSLNVAKKLLDTAVEINPEYISDIVKEALANIGAATVKKIRVSPEDMEFINLIGLGKSIKEFDGSWDFEADASIKSGCVLESSAGEIDYQLDDAWERVKDSVMKVIR
ncbi:MAG: FliH/SctL family protein [Bdellovibrionota bacterium]